MAAIGAQPGNQNAAKGRRWTEAIDKALKQYTDKKRKIEAGQALDRIARNLVKLALDGDLWANQEIGNRLDGKPAQGVVLSGDEDNPLQVISKVERVIVRAKPQD